MFLGYVDFEIGIEDIFGSKIILPAARLSCGGSTPDGLLYR